MAAQAERERAGRRARILEEALREGREALRHQARRHAPGEAEAEEAIQEASVDFLCSYDGPAGTDAVRWLSVAIKHRAWQQGKTRSLHLARTASGRAEGPEQLPADAGGPSDQMARAEAVERFFAALAQLKPDERIALLLFGLGCSYREIGERQGWTYTKVNRCIAEGRAALRALTD